MPSKGLAGLLSDRTTVLAVDADDLLLGGVDAAGEDARLGRRQVPLRADEAAPVDPRMQAPDEPPPHVVVSHDADGAGGRPERRDVVGGVAGAAGHDLGGVVLEDQYGRLARHPGDASVDELVGQEIADDEDVPAGEGVDERGETREVGAAVRHGRAAPLRSPGSRRRPRRASAP